jgi:riboflavin kinase/FMN adenylyltransferase
VPTKLIRGLYNLPDAGEGCVATIGNFDGVHRGHQALIDRVTERAKAMNLSSVVVTFEPQPAEFFAKPEPAQPRLTRCREKFNALADCGVDKVMILHFDSKMANLSAADFVTRILCEGLNVKYLMVGDDFRFGKSRQGDFEFLKKAGEKYGFQVENISSVILENERISSTRVRNALLKGDHVLANKLLGHPYYMQGRIVHGAQRGRTIGFPTANIYLHRRVLPVQGVYSVRMYLDGKSFAGVANVGIRPTVGGTRSLLEVHLFDFNQEIYGRQVRVEFCEKIRDEKRYESLDLLKVQIQKDAAQAREYFKTTME